GVIGSELRHLRGVDVLWRSDGLVVMLGGRRARTVPVLERYHEPLTSAAAFAGDRYLVGGSSPERRNLTDTLTVALCADAGLPRFAGRAAARDLAHGLRATDRAWRVHARGRDHLLAAAR
ncbi:MAG TPA: hypothetical protein VKO16_00860, partial [Polyangia bacterium]|nr:hypothetical protein [Polyangia bacterium]